MAAIPLIYPKIPGSKSAPSGRCIAFEKYDGTNLHWVWHREYGWTDFGTRRDSFALDRAGMADFASAHPGLEEAGPLFLHELAQRLEAIFRDNPRYPSSRIVAFTEFFGPNSFAGMHRQGDDKQLVLFDVQTDRGIVGPELFVADFAALPSAQVVYRGRLTGKFADDVRWGRYSVAEGVVCKGGSSGKDVWMVKIKTNAYLEKLKQAFRDRWEDYWE
jgi:hypothetical protein